MNVLYTPWRAAYHQDPERRAANFAQRCPFCITPETRDAADHDAQHLIVQRFSHCYIMLNRYPYNPAHLMVIPYVHEQNLEQLPDAVLAQMMQATAHAMRLIQAVVPCPGFNIGMNIGGGVAGGTVPGHLHQHVLPRWPGDTGFTVCLSDTKAMSQSPEEFYAPFVQAAAQIPVHFG
jgi:ATP adenylyltransferase